MSFGLEEVEDRVIATSKFCIEVTGEIRIATNKGSNNNGNKTKQQQQAQGEPKQHFKQQIQVDFKHFIHKFKTV